MNCNHCRIRGQEVEMVYYAPLNVWECFNCGAEYVEEK